MARCGTGQVLLVLLDGVELLVDELDAEGVEELDELEESDELDDFSPLLDFSLPLDFSPVLDLSPVLDEVSLEAPPEPDALLDDDPLRLSVL